MSTYILMTVSLLLVSCTFTNKNQSETKTKAKEQTIIKWDVLYFQSINLLIVLFRKN